MTNKNEHIIGLDIVRSCAIYFVLAVHFFLNSEYYNSVLIGRVLFISTVFRWIFLSCVPLFIILSGYLLNKKKVSSNYYKRIIKILYEYFSISVLCNLYKIIYLKQEMNAEDWLMSVLEFKADPYSWYINMYIGLFLIIPFLNILYNNIKSDKEKKILIITMVLITSIPSFINTFYVILPNWWTSIYPITYYFIGCYLCEYKPKINKITLVSLILGIGILESMHSFFLSKSNNGLFKITLLNGYGALPTLMLSVFIFMLLYDIKIKNKILNKVFISISKCSLSIYLVSWIFDSIIYKILNSNVEAGSKRMVYHIIIVPICFALSYFVAYINQYIYIILKLIHNKLQLYMKKSY